MPRRKIEKENIRKLQNSKNSYYITLPIELIRKFGWKERQKLIVEEYGNLSGQENKIIIKDWKPKKK